MILAEVAGQFDRIPETKIVYLDQNAHFYCSITSQFLMWRVDGIQAQLPQIQARNISHVFSGSHSRSSTLTILATKQNNNSEIVCIQQHLMTGQELARTSPAYLRIQGINYIITWNNKVYNDITSNSTLMHRMFSVIIDHHESYGCNCTLLIALESVV